MPWLILIPLIAATGLGAWWYERNKAAAAVTPGSVAANAPGPVGVRAPVGTPLGIVNVPIAGALAGHLGALPIFATNKPGTVLVGVPAAGTTASIIMGQKIAAEANILLQQIPSKLPNDPTGLDWQVLTIGLQQLIANPTATQLQSTIDAFIKNGNQFAVDAASKLKIFV